MDLENRGKMVVKIDFVDVDTKNVVDWRKLFVVTFDQTLRFFLLMFLMARLWLLLHLLSLRK